MHAFERPRSVVSHEKVPGGLRIDPRALSSERPPAFVLGHWNLVRPFGMASIPVVVALTAKSDPLRHSRWVQGHCVVPGYETESAQERTLEVLLQVADHICGRVGRRIPLFCGGDDRLELVLRHREALSTYFLLPPDPEGVNADLVDKARFSRRCKARNVLSPRTSTVERARGDLRFPIVVKPRTKNRWHALQRAVFGESKARIFESREELARAQTVWEHAGELLCQEYIPGADDRLYSFHGVADGDAQVVAAFVGRKIRTHPRRWGESSYIELVNDPTLLSHGAEVIERLGVRGVFKVDFKRDERDDRDFTLEVNPRLTLWVHLGAMSGVNLPAVAYDQLLGRPVTPVETPYETGRRWMHVPRDFRAMRELHAHGRLSWARWLSEVLSLRTIHDGFAWSDPLPLARSLVDRVRLRTRA